MNNNIKTIISAIKQKKGFIASQDFECEYFNPKTGFFQNFVLIEKNNKFHIFEWEYDKSLVFYIKFKNKQMSYSVDILEDFPFEICCCQAIGN